MKKNYNIAPNDNRSVAEFYREAVGFHQKAIETLFALRKIQPDNAEIYRFIADEQMIVAEPLTEIGEPERRKKICKPPVSFLKNSPSGTRQTSRQNAIWSIFTTVTGAYSSPAKTLRKR